MFGRFFLDNVFVFGQPGLYALMEFFQLIGVKIVDIVIIFGRYTFQDTGVSGIKKEFVDLLEHLTIVFSNCPSQGFTFLDGNADAYIRKETPAEQGDIGIGNGECNLTVMDHADEFFGGDVIMQYILQIHTQRLYLFQPAMIRGSPPDMKNIKFHVFDVLGTKNEIVVNNTLLYGHVGNGKIYIFQAWSSNGKPCGNKITFALLEIGEHIVPAGCYDIKFHIHEVGKFPGQIILKPRGFVIVQIIGVNGLIGN